MGYSNYLKRISKGSVDPKVETKDKGDAKDKEKVKQRKIVKLSPKRSSKKTSEVHTDYYS